MGVENVGMTTVEKYARMDLIGRLRSNIHLSSMERETTALLTRQACEDQKEIDRQIHALQKRRRKLDQYRSQWQSLCSPIRKLPNELLSMIFVYCGTFMTLDDTSGSATTLPGFDLELVCTHWRKVALSTPSLWSCLNIRLYLYNWDAFDVPPVAHSLWRTAKDTLQMFLQRSGDAPLDIALHIGTSRFKDSPALVLLFSHAHRWRTFKLTLGRGELEERVLEPLRDRLLLLQVAEVGAQGTKIGVESMKVFESATNLRVWHSKARAGLSDGTVDGFKTNISTLYLYDKSTLVFQHLPAASHLQNLHVSLYEKEFPSKTILQCDLPVVSTTLRSLTLTLSQSSTQNESAGIFNRVLESLQCPNLVYLCIDFADRGDLLNFTSLKRFIAKSGGQLTSLSLLNANITEAFLINTLSLLPTLRDLSIQESIVAMPMLLSPNVVKALRSTSRLLPDLQHLAMRVSCDDGVVDEAIARLAICLAEDGLKTFSMELLNFNLEREEFDCWKGIGHLPFHAEVKTISHDGKKEAYLCSCA
jgi:hypothetical protein